MAHMYKCVLCVFMYVLIYVFMCMFMCVFICVYVCLCVFICVFVRVYIDSNMPQTDKTHTVLFGDPSFACLISRTG